MTRDELISELTPIIRTIFQDEALQISDNLSATEISTWTSLSFMQLLAAIEEKYSFRFKIIELLELTSLGAIIDATFTHIK